MSAQSSLPGPAAEKRSGLSEKSIPWVVFFSTTFVVATVYMTQPIMGTLSRSFNEPLVNISLAMSIVSMMYALSFVLYGSISDKYGRRPILVYGILVLAIITGFTSMAANFSIFLLMTAIQGLAAGALPATAIPYMADITPRDRIGQAMGIALSGTIAGTVLGRSLSGVLTEFVGWRATYVIFALLLVLGFLFLVRIPQNSQRNPDLSIIRTLVNTFSLLGRFRILLLMLVGGCLFFAYLGSVTYITPYLSEPPFNYGPGIIGLLNLAGVVGIIVSPLSGRAVATYGSYRVMLTGQALALVSILMMAYTPSVWLVGLGLVMLYAGVFICQPAVFSLVATVTEADRRGGASALYLLACMGGGSLGAYLLGSVYQSHQWLGVAGTGSAVCAGAIIIGLIYTRRFAR